eukprot:7385917-Prymnesium_polylepis.1
MATGYASGEQSAVSPGAAFMSSRMTTACGPAAADACWATHPSYSTLVLQGDLMKEGTEASTAIACARSMSIASCCALPRSPSGVFFAIRWLTATTKPVAGWPVSRISATMATWLDFVPVLASDAVWSPEQRAAILEGAVEALLAH